jgi:hypothetical protein
VGLKLSKVAGSATLGRGQRFLAWVGWLMVLVLTIGLFSASIPAYYDYLVSFSDPDLEPATVRANLEAIGISVDFYATYLLWVSAASAMAWVAVSVVVFWRGFGRWMALFTSLTLITSGTFAVYDGPTVLAEQYSAVWLPVQLLGFIGSVSLVLFFFLFPDGRFVPRWTRWMAVLWAAHEAAYYFFPGSFLNTYRSLPLLNFVTIAAVAFIAAGSQIYRYRRVSGPIERQQTKWVVFGTVVAMLGAVGFAIPLYTSPMIAQYGSLYTFAFEAGVFGSLLLLPLSIGVAILGYRLWDVDIIINRALVYSTLTVTLGLVFFGGVTLLQVMFRTITGGESQLAIVASTLIIAALAEPLRRRVHAFIDRRFYRRKYDARKTLEVFSTELRDETDLDALSDDLVGVVRETMQPEHVSLWLRPDAGKHREQAG